MREQSITTKIMICTCGLISVLLFQAALLAARGEDGERKKGDIPYMGASSGEVARLANELLRLVEKFKADQAYQGFRDCRLFILTRSFLKRHIRRRA